MVGFEFDAGADAITVSTQRSSVGDRITVNVGGTPFVTTRATLQGSVDSQLRPFRLFGAFMKLTRKVKSGCVLWQI